MIFCFEVRTNDTNELNENYSPMIPGMKKRLNKLVRIIRKSISFCSNHFKFYRGSLDPLQPN